MNPPAPRFQVVTLANDPAQYDEMRRSFDAAGFTGENARFTLFDNRAGNRHDPYEILRQLPRTGDEPYVVMCHQDIRLDLGHGYAQLVAEIGRLDARHPRWTVAGNAGGGYDGRLLVHLNEPAGQRRETALPARACSLDENFLLLRRTTRPFCSPGLHGFHLYGTDVCLNAIRHGGSAHVIDFLLTHLSPGNASSAAYTEAKTRLIQHWQGRFLAGLVQTSCAAIPLSCSRWVRSLLEGYQLRRLLFSLKIPLIPNPLCFR